MNLDLNKLCKEAHENAKNKGFYDDKVEFETLISLIHSEVSEALEADRKGHYAYLQEFEEEEFTAKSFEYFIKNSLEDELADICIRIFDAFGYLEEDLKKSFDGLKDNEKWSICFGGFNSANAYIHYFLSQSFIADMHSFYRFKNLALALHTVFSYCEHRGINIEKHIKYKMKYNKTRPKKHGKRY